MITLFCWAVAGSFIGMVVSSFSGVHVYSLISLLLTFGAHDLFGANEGAFFFMVFSTGMVIASAFGGGIASILFSTPDELAFLTVLPAQRLLSQGRAREAVMLSIIGSVGGFLYLSLLVLPSVSGFISIFRTAMRPHYHWALWCILCFMVMSEWPRYFGPGTVPRQRFMVAWIPLFAGLYTLLASGLLGFVLQYKSPFYLEKSFTALAPVFAGFFTIPTLLLNLFSAGVIGEQKSSWGRVGIAEMARGMFAGCAGGTFAVLTPSVTGGVGSFLAGHATALRNERSFIISQGAARAVYMCGAILLFFSPYLGGMAKGGAATLIKMFYTPSGIKSLWHILCITFLSAATAIFMSIPFARVGIFFAAKFGRRKVSVISLFLVTGITYALCGWSGIIFMMLAALIGLVPPLFGTRRMNCLGVILIPSAIRLSGWGTDAALFLGII